MDCIERCRPEELPALLLFCRPGFEADCAAEIARRDHVPGGRALYRPEQAQLLYWPATDAETLHQKLDFRRLIFCRQWQLVEVKTSDLHPASLAEALSCSGKRFRDAAIVFADSQQGQSLSQLARKLESALLAELRTRGWLTADSLWGARICLLGERLALTGRALCQNSSPYPAGVPRLRLPPGSPSRSSLKLEEALVLLLGDDERRRYLRPGLRAVDLGAAPGGWSQALSRRGLLVTAVDRARLARQVAENDLVEHVRADGFTYRPPQPVEWLFCDIIDKPARVSRRVAEWLERGWCRRAIFNLKLPMKRRLEQVELELARLGRALSRHGRPELRCRQLYHDRREVTCYATINRNR